MQAERLLIKKKYRGFSLDGFDLKMLAILFMLLDHFAWIYLDSNTLLGQSLHFFGRLTAPIMCFFIVEGFFHSNNIKKYAFRLTLFALLSQIPFTLITYSFTKIMHDPLLILSKGNVLFNLLLALLSLIIFHAKFENITKLIAIACLLGISTFFDWGIFLICFCLVLAYYRDDRKRQAIAYLLVAMGLLLIVDLGLSNALPILILSWFPIGILLAPVLWISYNGERGKSFGGKYFFYIFYPLHLIILATVADFYGFRITT
ncbi:MULTISPECIES: TraX family protein [unclassified Acinetobacter]|uniref:TraX family protein n=1 Tax=unclassified Acinetobacter TaxID=196816 RepID=UPI0035B8AEA1